MRSVLIILTPVIKHLAQLTFRTDCISGAKFFIKPILIFFSDSERPTRLA
jgi:hypothetical protein